MPRGRTHQCQILDLPGEKRWHLPQPRTLWQDWDQSHPDHLIHIQKIPKVKNDKGRWEQWLVDMVMAQWEETGWLKKAIWKKLWSMECTCNNAWQTTIALGTNNGRHRLSQIWGLQPDNPAVHQESTSKSDRPWINVPGRSRLQVHPGKSHPFPTATTLQSLHRS